MSRRGVAEGDQHGDRAAARNGDERQDKPVGVNAGLLVRGVVCARRKRRVGQKESELVTYVVDPGGVEVAAWNPTTYFSIGEEVEVRVAVRVFQGKGGLRYSLEIPSADGQF
jgi:hypothetical protein